MLIVLSGQWIDRSVEHILTADLAQRGKDVDGSLLPRIGLGRCDRCTRN